MDKFYFDNRDEFDLKRSFYIEPEGTEELDENGDLIERGGYIALEDKILEAEENGTILKKKLFSVHTSNVDVRYTRLLLM